MAYNFLLKITVKIVFCPEGGGSIEWIWFVVYDDEEKKGILKEEGKKLLKIQIFSFPICRYGSLIRA